MSYRPIFIGIIIILIIIIFYLFKFRKISSPIIMKKSFPAPIENDKYKDYEVNWNKLTDGEKGQYIVDTYFTYLPENEQISAQQEQDDTYINSLPKNSDCDDVFDECANWADDGECKINPEFMLYKCPKSCEVCSISEQNKNKMTRIYNSRPLEHCVYHGASYPGEFKYLNKMYDYIVNIDN
jgi:hypothetical protein